MAGGDDDTSTPETIAASPRRLPAVRVSRTDPPRSSESRGEPAGPGAEPAGDAATAVDPSPLSTAHTLSTAADAMHDEEIERTRLFIRLGWAISVATIASVPLLHAPRVMNIAFVTAMSVGIVVSAWFHRAFADPARYTARALVILAEMCLVNAHVTILYYGTFTVAPLIVVIGIHFVARTEAERAARWIFATGIFLYTLIALAIITGAITDPGVFASDRPLHPGAAIAGALFVLGSYTLAYVTARSFRTASLRSIENLQRATRLASQREALMDELRLDLERALRVGGPGRYTDHIVGNFKLGPVLGRGATGEVYDAAHLATGEPAAIKLLRRELLTDPTHITRLLREAKASSTLDSPHVVKVLDTFTPSPTGAAPSPPYLAMERLHGETLAERLRKDTRLTPAAVAELLRHIGAGLDTARRAGIIHRDIKPQNLFHDRVWKILDFGVAALVDETSTLTQGGIIGTPSYMAPEQAQGHKLDSRADLYALAAVAYRCLTGRHPFSGADTPALLYAVVHKAPPRPGSIVDLPADIDRWFAIALAKSPSDRFPTGADLSATFDAALISFLDPTLRKRADDLFRDTP